MSSLLKFTHICKVSVDAVRHSRVHGCPPISDFRKWKLDHVRPRIVFGTLCFARLWRKESVAAGN